MGLKVLMFPFWNIRWAKTCVDEFERCYAELIPSVESLCCFFEVRVDETDRSSKSHYDKLILYGYNDTCISKANFAKINEFY